MGRLLRRFERKVLCIGEESVSFPVRECPVLDSHYASITLKVICISLKIPAKRA
jgi:hypothetical protein